MFQLGLLVVRAAVLGSAAATFVRYCRIDPLQMYRVVYIFVPRDLTASRRIEWKGIKATLGLKTSTGATGSTTVASTTDTTCLAERSFVTVVRFSSDVLIDYDDRPAVACTEDRQNCVLGRAHLSPRQSASAQHWSRQRTRLKESDERRACVHNDGGTADYRVKKARGAD